MAQVFFNITQFLLRKVMLPQKRRESQVKAQVKMHEQEAFGAST